MKADEAIIRLEDVSKTFLMKERRVEAVKHVTMNIRQGEIYGIIGFSGAGKSTLVRCMNLLERVTSGKVFFDGTELMKLRPDELRRVRRGIGMIFQQFNLMKSRTVAGNVALPLEGTGRSRRQIEERVRELLDYVELSDKLDAYPSQLSGGQKQRVAIARALAGDPKVLLCDEATSALDPQTTRSILNLLVRLNSELGITIVVITHEMAVIKKICDRVAVMEDGCVVEEGEVFSIFANPKQQITRQFINTTTNLYGIYDLLEENPSVIPMKSGDCLILMRYLRARVSEPLISAMSVQFHVVFNILFSDVEMISGCPIGGTVAVLHGSEPDKEAVFVYLKEKEISVEVIHSAGAS